VGYERDNHVPGACGIDVRQYSWKGCALFFGQAPSTNRGQVSARKHNRAGDGVGLRLIPATEPNLICVFLMV